MTLTGGKLKYWEKTPVTVPLCPPQISRELAYGRTRPWTKCLHYMHKDTFTLQILLLHVYLISDGLHVLKSAFPGKCNLVVLFKCGHQYSEAESASGEPVLVLQLDTGLAHKQHTGLQLTTC